MNINIKRNYMRNGVVYIKYDVVLKYKGDISNIKQELDVNIEILSSTYAIITLSSVEDIENLISYPQIECIEKPFILEKQDEQILVSKEINNFKNISKLTGKGTVLGIINSGIDYNLPIFKDAYGKSKILYYWDQSITSTPPEGFKEGTLYTNEDINNSIKNEATVPIYSNSYKGAHIASICSEIANEANIIAVKVGSKNTDTCARSTEIMRAIKFILDKSRELKMPVAISINYISNEKSHREVSLFEEYIDEMCLYWKNNIVIPVENNKVKKNHTNIKLTNKIQKVEVLIDEGETIVYINIWQNFEDDFAIYLVNPLNQRSQRLSQTFSKFKNLIGNTKISGYLLSTSQDSIQRKITFKLSSDYHITKGVWKIIFTPISIINGNVDIYLQTPEKLSKGTKILNPNKGLTAIASGTDSRVIIGTPHIAGICSLLLQWGIVNGNDSFLYSTRLKELILKSSVKSEKIGGYELLRLSIIKLEQFLDINKSSDCTFRKRTKVIKQSKNIGKNVDFNLSRMSKTIQGVNILHEPNFEEEMRLVSKEINFYKISDEFGVVFIDENNYDLVLTIISLPSVIRHEPTVMLAPLSEISQSTTNGINANEEIGANFLKNNPNLALTGKGVLITIIGSGIDYLHPDFINTDGTSKILFLWDQTKEGNPPKGYLIGVEYTRTQINEAISKNDYSLSFDEDGSGTMNAGICSGLGNINSEYKGVAEGSELIVIKMGKINGHYNNAMYFAAYDYAIQKAAENRMPVVINESYGKISYAGLYTRAILDETFYTRGICTVTAAGNEGNTQTHSSGKILFKGDIKYVEFSLNDYEEEVRIQIWMNKPDIINASIITPTGEYTRKNVLSNYSVVSGILDIEQTKYEITNIYPTSYSGQQQIVIKLTSLKSGIWKIRLEGEYITNGIYNVYLPNRILINENTRFQNSDPYDTITYPATFEDNITVGAYDIADNSLWPKTSRGLAISGLQKPDIVAPGVNIVAPYPQNRYAMIAGTSAAASYTAGGVALLLQYLLVNQEYPDKGFVQSIRTYLRIGATRNDNMVYPNTEYGFGILNIRNSFEQFR